jgi:hypothetical protein
VVGVGVGVGWGRVADPGCWERESVLSRLVVVLDLSAGEATCGWVVVRAAVPLRSVLALVVALFAVVAPDDLVSLAAPESRADAVLALG